MFFKRKKTESRNRTDRQSKTRRSGSSSTRNLEKFIVEEVVLSGDARRTSIGNTLVHKPPAPWIAPAKAAAGWTLLWLIVILAPLFSRNLWPPDETHRLAVVWQMWTSGNFIVPSFNGGFVPEVAPLHAWLTHLGWWAFGVSDVWPRLLPALFALASMFLGGALARFLWPGRVMVARYVPGILLGGFFWAGYSTLAVSGMPLVFFTLLAAYALAWTWRRRDLRVWLLLGLALGLGSLTQGGMIYLYILPLALLAPLWANEGPRPNWGYWYTDIFKACVMGLVIFLAWAVPLGMRSGARHGVEAFFLPFAAQSLDLFSPESPWWWYLALLPLLGLPWFVWPLTWLRLWHMRGERMNAGIVFCMVWSVPVIVLLSLFSVRQPQFLLPLVPAFVLVVAFLLLDEDLSEHQHDSLASTMIFPLILLGGLLAVFPGLPRVEFLPDLLWNLSPFVGIAVVLVGIMLAFLPLPEVRARVANMTSAVVVVVSLTLLGIGWQYNSLYDASNVATLLQTVQGEQRPLSVVGKYTGDFDFAARLAQPMRALAADDAAAWLEQNPRGLIVSFTRDWQPAPEAGFKLAYEIPYYLQAVRLWEARPAEAVAPVTPAGTLLPGRP